MFTIVCFQNSPDSDVIYVINGVLKLHNQLTKLPIPAYDLDEAEVAVVDIDADSLKSDSFQQ